MLKLLALCDTSKILEVSRFSRDKALEAVLVCALEAEITLVAADHQT